MSLQTKRTFKQDPVKLSLFRIFRVPTNSGYYIFGKTRSGKTVLMLRISCGLHDKYSFKVWDLWGGKRNQGENLYWCLPSPYKNYWNLIKRKFRFDKEGPKQYKVNLCYPLTKDMPKELPHLKNDKDEVIINPQPFTIPIKDLSVQLIKFVLNNVSDSDVTLFEDIMQKLKKSDGMPELVRIFEKKGSNTSIYKNFFAPLIEMRMLSSDEDENSFDIVKEARDKEGIFVLVLHHIPEKFRLLIIGWIIQKMWDAMNMSRISGKNLVNIREATEFFRATEKTTIENRFKQFKIFLTEFIRQARGRMAFNLDVQSPQESSGLVRGSADIEIFGKMPNEDDRKYATDQLKRDGKITTQQITEIGELEAGQYFFFESGKDAKKRYTLLPRCDFFRETDQNFYLLWKKRVGKHAFKNFSSHIKHIDDQFRLKLKYLNEIEKQKALDRTEKDKIRENIDENKKNREKLEREKEFELQRRRMKQEVTEQMKKEKKINKPQEHTNEKKGSVTETYSPHEAKLDGATPPPSIDEEKLEIDI